MKSIFNRTLKKSVLAIATLTLLMGSCAAFAAAPTPTETAYVNKSLGLTKNIYVRDTKMVDLNGDKKPETLKLLVKRFAPGDIYADEIMVLIQDGRSKKLSLWKPKNLGGYEPVLQVLDFTGDHKPELMITSPTGGSGGFISCRIGMLKNGSIQQIFSETQTWSGDGEFVDGYKAAMKIKNSAITFEIDLSADKAYYQNLKIYDDKGKCLNVVGPTFNGGDDFRAIGPIADQHFLVVNQRIVGYSNANTPGYLETTYEYNFKTDKFEPIAMYVKSPVKTK